MKQGKWYRGIPMRNPLREMTLQDTVRLGAQRKWETILVSLYCHGVMKTWIEDDDWRVVRALSQMLKTTKGKNTPHTHMKRQNSDGNWFHCTHSWPSMYGKNDLSESERILHTTHSKIGDNDPLFGHYVQRFCEIDISRPLRILVDECSENTWVTYHGTIC